MKFFSTERTGGRRHGRLFVQFVVEIPAVRHLPELDDLRVRASMLPVDCTIARPSDPLCPRDAIALA